MASSASDAGHSEKSIREQLVKTGAVDIMVSVGNNFFYTRSLPCTLWFYDRTKEKDETKKDKILMLDARKVYRKVTTTINDFSPEQSENLTAIVKMYRGDNDYLHNLLKKRQLLFEETLKQAISAFDAEVIRLSELKQSTQAIHEAVDVEDKISYDEERSVIDGLLAEQEHNLRNLKAAFEQVLQDLVEQHDLFNDVQNKHNAVHNLWSFANAFLHDKKAFMHQAQAGYKKLFALWKALEVKHVLRKHKLVVEKKVLITLDQLEAGHYTHSDTWKHAAHLIHENGWMCKKFTDGVYLDVDGLCKVVSQQEVAEKDYSLSPGRYVGVDTSSIDDADYEERLKQIHLELEELNGEAVQLAQVINENYKEI